MALPKGDNESKLTKITERGGGGNVKNGGKRGKRERRRKNKKKGGEMWKTQWYEAGVQLVEDLQGVNSYGSVTCRSMKYG